MPGIDKLEAIILSSCLQTNGLLVKYISRIQQEDCDYRQTAPVYPLNHGLTNAAICFDLVSLA